MAAPRVEVVDTTGAGDAFMAALLYRLARDEARPGEIGRERLLGHLAFACEIGAGAVTKRGAIAGLPPRAR
ncbi:MAG: PfkB family carbohydrate kinase [bacterium]